MRCIRASTVPEAGSLYPLGQDFFVSPDGRVGIGTLSPAMGLDMQGVGGNPSTIRLLNQGASGAGGIVMTRLGGTAASWSLLYDSSGGTPDFLIHDNLAADTRLRITQNGRTQLDALELGTASTGVQLYPAGSTLVFAWGGPGAVGPSALIDLEIDRIVHHRETELRGGAHVGDGVSIQFDEDDVFGLHPPMIYMFEDGATNFDRMVLAHSELFDDWGLRYDDDIDSFHFLSGGAGVLTVDLADKAVGIGAPNPSRILAIQQGSPTDPIADAWTTYSSRRWKENVQPLEAALDTVRRLRGVTFDWTETGEHDLGMIAEEVGEVLPELVAYEDNGVDAQSIDYARLSAVLVEAVKEQDQLLAEQAAELGGLRSTVAELLERVAALESP